jgi:hypothetical protein
MAYIQPNALERAAFERDLSALRRDLAALKLEIAAKRAAERREAHELRRKSDLAYENFLRVFRRDAQQHKYSPDQPRVPAGNSDGGQWTDGSGSGTGRNDPRVLSDVTPDHEAKPGARYAANRPRGGTFVRIGGRTFSVEGGQAARLQEAQGRAESAIARVRDLEPNWRPTPSIDESVEGRIKTLNAEAREADARFVALSRVGYDEPYATRNAQTTADVLRPGGQLIGVRDPDVNTRDVRILSPEQFEAARIALMANARRIEPDVRYDGVWYEREDGTRFGLRLSADHGLTLEVVRGDYYLPNTLKFHQR